MKYYAKKSGVKNFNEGLFQFQIEIKLNSTFPFEYIDFRNYNISGFHTYDFIIVQLKLSFFLGQKMNLIFQILPIPINALAPRK